MAANEYLLYVPDRDFLGVCPRIRTRVCEQQQEKQEQQQQQDDKTTRHVVV